MPTLSPFGAIKPKDVFAIRGGTMRTAQRDWRALCDALGRPATWRDLAAHVGAQLDEIARQLGCGYRFNCA